MRLIPNFHAVLRKAWSVRFALLAALFSGLEALALVLPHLGGVFPPRTLAVLATLAAIGAVGARIVDQPKMRGDE
jgi:hypothetical protein